MLPNGISFQSVTWLRCLPATEKGLRDRLERNRAIYAALRSRRGRSVWKQLIVLTGMTKPRLGRGLFELERYGVIERVWLVSERCWMYTLTDQELGPLEPFYKKSATKKVYKDYSGGMKVLPLTVHQGRRRTLRWQVPKE